MGLLQVVTVIVSVFILGSCSAPTRPTISEKFLAEYEVERHDKGGLEYGQGRMGRDPENNRAFFNSTYDKKRDVDFELQLYGDHVIYAIKGLRNKGQCITEDLNAAYLPTFWSWLSRARYVGQKEIRHVMYDFWTTEEDGIKFEVGVEANSSTPSIPRYYSKRVAELEVTYMFTKFDPVVPPSSDFIVPKECLQPPTGQFKTGTRDMSDDEMINELYGKLGDLLHSADNLLKKSVEVIQEERKKKD